MSGNNNRMRVVTLAGALAGFMALALPGLANDGDNADEILFYREDGLYRYYDIRPNGSIPSPLRAGDEYTEGWDSITAVDLDGDGQDEIFFYRKDGLFRFYDIHDDGRIGSPIKSGDNYTAGWDAIVAVDIDRDGQDELFFYRKDGLYRFYDVHADGSLGSPISSGTDFTSGWDIIAAVDLDANARDELFFYRSDGTYGFYEITPLGALGGVIRQGNEYTTGWDSISAIDLDGDGNDELMFYRSDGLYRYYDVRPDASLSSPISAGSEYTTGWKSIVGVDLNGDLPFERISRFTTYFDCCQSRVTNIRLLAAEIDGTVVLPGDTFSIDAVAGPRTAAKGYLPGGYLIGGKGACCVIGGGVSQFGTTIHNAVFWGGFDVVFHRPHTRWISRYPLGIESTLFYGSLDYKFTNDTLSPVTIKTSSTGTSITVEIWGKQGGWRVTGWHPRGSRNSRITVLDYGGVDAKRVTASVIGSAPGHVTVYRTLTRNGVGATESWGWTYVDPN